MSESYIGLAPSYGVFEVQRIAGTTATTYDLDFEVAQATQVLVSVDGIVQEPDYAFTIGRSSAGKMQLVFSAALSVTSLTCSTTANSATVGVSSSANLNVGQSISGTNIPANSFISTIVNATSITISNVATNTSGSVGLSFGSRIFCVYLGKQLLTPSTDQADTTPLVEHFNGGASSYTLTRTPPNQSSILVFVHGVFQRGSGNAYTLSGSTINFGSNTPSGTNAVTVHYVATENNSVPAVSDASITNAKLNLDYSDATYRAPTKVTTTAGQTTQTIKQISATRYYDENDILVLLNGICLIPDDDYTITGNTTLTLTGGAPPTGSSLVIRYLAL